MPDPNSPAYTVSHTGLRPTEKRRGFLRAFGEVVMDFLTEGIVALLAVGLFAGVAALAVAGWNYSKPTMLGLGAAFVAFIGYGVIHIARSGKPRWPRLAAAGVITLVVMVLWATYVLQYHSW